MVQPPPPSVGTGDGRVCACFAFSLRAIRRDNPHGDKTGPYRCNQPVYREKIRGLIGEGWPSLVGDHEITNIFGWLRETLVSCANKPEVLLDYPFGCPAALCAITTNSTDETKIIACVDEDSKVEKFCVSGVGKNVKTFDDHHRPRIYSVYSIRHAVMNCKIIDWLQDRHSLSQIVQV